MRMLFGKAKRHVKRILIVEDEPLVAFDNETMVTSAGYTVVATVDSAGEALAIIKRELGEDAGIAGEDADERGIDLLLTDITLTGERNGLDLAAEAQKFGLAVLFATALPPEGGEALGLGVLLKPYNERRLRAALKAAEQVMAGKKNVRAPDGMVLFPQPA